MQRNVPRLWMFPIRAMYLEAINRASRNVWMTTAYFIPDQDFVDAMKNAARRGVDVRLLVPLKSNHIVADWISRGYFSQLLDAGVRILRFNGAMVHAKTATVDGTWTTVGTANIDRLSLQGNYEINVEVIDEALAAELEEIFTTDEANCLPLTRGEWETRDLHRKFTEALPAPAPPAALGEPPCSHAGCAACAVAPCSSPALPAGSAARWPRPRPARVPCCTSPTSRRPARDGGRRDPRGTGERCLRPARPICPTTSGARVGRRPPASTARWTWS